MPQISLLDIGVRLPFHQW